MTKQTLTVRLQPAHAAALEHFSSVTGTSRSKVLETILADFCGKPFLEQSALLRRSLRSPRQAGSSND